MNRTCLVTLITDFGHRDPYVGQMKGAILRHNRNCTIIDLCHHIPAHDVLHAALVLKSSYGYFPSQTIHLVVVDPGVGSQRTILVAAGDDHLFVAPDNGVLSLLMQDGKITEIRRVENRAIYPSNISATFHGRDIMAPVVAALGSGLPLADIGPAVKPEECVQITVAHPVIGPCTIQGEVIHIDHFGNIRTNITAASLSRFQPDRFQAIEIKGHRIREIVTTYADRPRNQLIALIDSSGYLEIAVNQGNAAKMIGCDLHQPVRVVWRQG